tara:strand:+ start:325 stop:777 length:453 start_codon:yes stop_codon:yes gene_type:complete
VVIENLKFKKMQKFIVLGFLALSLFSCKKDDGDSSSAIVSNPTSFQEITVGPNFNWSTQTEYSLQVVAMKNMPYTRSNYLKVFDQDSNVVFQALISTRDNKVLNFRAERDLSNVTVSFGSISKKVAFTNNRGEFDFIPFDDQSDIEPDNN